MENRYIRLYSVITLLGSLLFIVLVSIAAVRETWFLEWQKTQKQYKHILENISREPGETYPSNDFRIMVRQVDLPGLKRTDRCMSCHPALENPAMKEQDPPFGSHPGKCMSYHPVQEFGCTICHGGQGSALNKKEAFAIDRDVHWDSPLLSQPFLQSSCGKCHASLFTLNDYPDIIDSGMLVFNRGKIIFTEEGCLGCHKARGVGGTIGPDLTGQGDKTWHEYNFENIAGEQSIANWLKEHFRDPEMVSPGSQMLSFDLGPDELEALATFSMGLSIPDLPYTYLSENVLNELKSTRNIFPGDYSYPAFCTACHGKRGEGKDYEQYETGVPAIFNDDFLRTASADYILFTIQNGRGKRQMASWLPRFSGLSDNELISLTEFIREQKIVQSSLEGFVRETGNKQQGESLYQEHCLMCHGKDAVGDVALGFNQPDFFRAISREYLFFTIRKGRSNTAMPSWPGFNNQDMADMITYIYSLNGKNSHHNRSVQLAEGDSEKGALSFHYLCSRCHGESGEGGTGPAIINKEFLEAADDYFLYMTISNGRYHTAMHGWSEELQGSDGLNPDEMADIIAFFRSNPYEKWEYIYPGPVIGKRERGSELFVGLCAECHGPDAEGTRGPQLNNQEFLNAATNGYLMATISLGRNNSPMPSWGKGGSDHRALTGEEREDLIAFIRSFQKVMIKK